MRSISANGLAMLAQRLGTEPINLIEVYWASGPVSYADKTLPGVKGRILDVSDLDNTINTQTGNSQSITITLDDTDGSIKEIFNGQDIHQRDVNVYQHFDGLDLTDKFLLFRGKITSPIVWNEGDRTLTLTVVSQLEDKEFGFSAEEGQFPFLPKDLVGKAWPAIFGKCLDVPALQVNQAVSGTTLCGIGILSGKDLHNEVPLGGDDCSFGSALAMMDAQISFLNACEAAFKGEGSPSSLEEAQRCQQQSNDILLQMGEAIASYESQRLCGQQVRESKVNEEEAEGCNPVRILGGEDFPQFTPIQLNINGGLFTGVMANDSFSISLREHPRNDEKAQEVYDAIEPAQCQVDSNPIQFFDFAQNVPCGFGDFLDGCQIHRHGFIICNKPQTSRPSASQVAQHFWAEPGSRVVMASDEPITYIVSIIPGTVLAVKAYKEFQGERRLVNVPNNLYTVGSATYGTVTAVQVVLTKPLSTIEDQGWSDDIYVTFHSSVGPNIVDILIYIINNYTDLTWDPTSFGIAWTKLGPFPANFPVLDRKNTLDLLREIAFQARCALWLSNGVFYIKYLPDDPTSVDTLTVSDIENKSVSVELTPTEDLVTKLTVTWRLSWAPKDPEKIILRNNVDKYGIKKRDEFIYIYNQPDIVLKVATFWLIRWSNTWKKLRFSTFLNKLALETFDAITLDLPAYVASSAVKAIVENATYNSNDQMVDFECWVPVRSGEMVQYQFAWPAALTLADTFAFTGGDGIGAGATGSLPVGYTDGIGQGGTVFVGGPNVVFRAQSDRGDRTPGDAGFVAQTIIPATVFAEINTAPNPNPDLTLNYLDKMSPPIVPQLPSSGITIDIRKTNIIDSDNPGATAHLDSIIREINDEDLILDTDAKFGDGDNTEAFDFKYDEDGGKFGAGTAFLKDD